MCVCVCVCVFAGTQDKLKPSNDIVKKSVEGLETKPNEKWFNKHLQLHFQTEGISVKVRPKKKSSAEMRVALTHPTESIISVHQIGSTMAIIVDDSTSVTASYKCYAYVCNDTATVRVRSVFCATFALCVVFNDRYRRYSG